MKKARLGSYIHKYDEFDKIREAVDKADFQVEDKYYPGVKAQLIQGVYKLLDDDEREILGYITVSF